MWQLFTFLTGFLIYSPGVADVETIAREDVDLECIGTKINDTVLVITWKRSNGTLLFHCDPHTPCDSISSIHKLGRNDTFSSSTVTIWNVSLVHEDQYDITMQTLRDTEYCKVNLTVNVPPKGLILVDKSDDAILKNNGTLTVAKGESKTLVCKTNSSLKPSVRLEWVFPNKLNASVEPQNDTYGGHDERLLVPTRTIHFSPTYADGEDIVLICEVASNSTHDHIQTSVIIKNEGECTTNRVSLETGSKKSHTVTTSIGEIQDFTSSGTSYTTHFEPTTQETTENPWYKKIHLVIPGFFGVVMLLVVLAFVGGSIRSKKRAVIRSMNPESTEFRPPQGRRSLPPTPSDQSSLPTNHLPDQPPPTPRLFRPVPSNQPVIPMRPLVPVSEDAIRSPAERTGSRIPGETFTTDGRTPVKQAQRDLDTEMKYDLLNHSHQGVRGAVPHVYRKASSGSAEYALVSGPKVKNRIVQQEIHLSKEINDDSDYDLLNTWNQAEHGTVPHVYKETTSGLAEYAVVSKPVDEKKRQYLGPLTKTIKAPINVEAEYAVVDKSKKRAK